MNLSAQPLTGKRRYLRGLVYEKNRWDHPLAETDKVNGFLGWHERGYLPHCDKPGLVQFVTLRLLDSLPAARQSEWEHLLKIQRLAFPPDLAQTPAIMSRQPVLPNSYA